MTMDFEDFMLKQTDWRGEVRTTLKAINKDIEELKNNQKAILKDISNLRRDMNNMRIKNATLYGGLSVILAIAVSLVTNGLLG